MAQMVQSEQYFVDKATEMIPKLRERGQEIEELRRIPEDLLQELKDIGFFKLLRPKKYGGFETNMKTYSDVVTQLSRGDASTGWIVGLCGIRELMVAESFGEKAHEEIFGENPEDVLFAGVYEPRKCIARKVDGGYLIEEGFWMFCSGSLHANWGYFGTIIQDEAGNVVDQLLMTLPFDELEIMDDWYVMGLKGSGSNSVKMNNVFIPEHRVVSFVDILNGNFQSSQFKDVPLYNTPLFQALILSLGLPALGAVKGAMDIFKEKLPSRKAANLGVEYLKDAASTHMDLSNAQLKIDSAEMHFYRLVNELDESAERGEFMTKENRIRALADIGHANQLCKEAMDIIIGASGSSFVYEGHPLQRVLRDFLTLHTHRSLSPTITKENYGRVLAGLETNQMRF